VDIQTLQKHVLTLATLEETGDPLISCYLNIEAGLPAATRALEERFRILRSSIPAAQAVAF